MAETNRNGWVDAFRFVLICIIVVHHFTLRYSQIYPEVGFSFVFREGGGIGNFVFMFISGYFLTSSLFNGYGVKAWFAYCVNKWWRFFPTAIICMTTIYIITHMLPIVEERMVTLSQLFLNFLIINLGWKPVDGSHWFIASLLQMQLLLSVLLFVKSSKKRLILLILLLIISFALDIFGDLNFTNIDNIIASVMCANWFPVLISGSISCLVINKRINIAFMLFPLCVSLYYVVNHHLLSVLVLLSIFLTICYISPKKKNPYFLSELGSVSFIWYLLHQNIGYCLMNVMREFHITSEWLLVVAAMTITLTLSFAVNVFCKKIPTKLIKEK